MAEELSNITLGYLLEKYSARVSFYLHFKMKLTTDEAEDITLESIQKLHSIIGTYNAKYSITTWLYRIAINRAIDLLRKKKSKPVIISLDDNSEPQSFEIKNIGYSAPEDYMNKDKRKMIRQAVYSLNRDYRNIIILRYFSGYSYAMVADVLGVPMGTVKNKLHRARYLLKPKLNHVRANY